MADPLDVFDTYRYIAVEGPIGVGKTSLARALAGRLGARLVLEPSDENPFLELFYADMARHALATQLAFLVARNRQQEELRQQDLFAPLAVSDYVFARDSIFAGLTLADDELRLYQQIYDGLAARAARPDLVVLLLADIDTLMARIERRGLPYEAGIDRRYVERLTAAYGEHFRLYDETPLLVVDTSGLDYAVDGLDLEALLDEMARTRSGQRIYVPEGRRL